MLYLARRAEVVRPISSTVVHTLQVLLRRTYARAILRSSSARRAVLAAVSASFAASMARAHRRLKCVGS